MVIGDMTGQKFGRLEVLGISHRDKFGHLRWRCLCVCGNETTVVGASLKNGKTKSCGCYRKEVEKVASRTHGLTNENGSVRVLYSRWLDMKKRCNNRHNKEYKNYGSRGIKVCKEWEHDYLAFHEWAISNGFNKTLTLDRSDVNKGYSPSNCRWATWAEQGRNKRLSPHNKTGIAGVQIRYDKYYVRIGVNGKRIYIGDYNTIEEAAEARKMAERKYWG